uniref:G-protein coupled receptors family 1 profile domain-containing protein n=1 Tax=Sus scrofa TaxID=9823 RepID=A0A8D1KYT9_PIG
MNMAAFHQNSTDFILLGLNTHPTFPGFIFAMIFSIFLVAVTANVVMIPLIPTDPFLNIPMYILFSLLSIMDTVYICITVPKMLQDLFSKEKTISFLGCEVQNFLYLTLIGGEFFLLGIMAYDLYMSVCNPLPYPFLINWRICLFTVVGSWVGSSLDGFMLTPFTMKFLMYPCCVLMLLIPISIISASHILILLTLHSAEGRHKGFATCSSHIMVVIIFYGAAFYTNVLPHCKTTPEKDKIVSDFYSILTPILSSLIYSLRNKDVAIALRRVMGRYASSHKIRVKDVPRKY